MFSSSRRSTPKIRRSCITWSTSMLSCLSCSAPRGTNRRCGTLEARSCQRGRRCTNRCRQVRTCCRFQAHVGRPCVDGHGRRCRSWRRGPAVLPWKHPVTIGSKPPTVGRWLPVSTANSRKVRVETRSSSDVLALLVEPLPIFLSWSAPMSLSRGMRRSSPGHASIGASNGRVVRVPSVPTCRIPRADARFSVVFHQGAKVASTATSASRRILA